MRRAYTEAKECRWLIISGRGLKGQLRHRSGNSKSAKDLQYHLKSLFVKWCQTQNIVRSFSSEIEPKWSTIDNYRQRLLKFSVLFTKNFTNGFGVFLTEDLKDAQWLVKERPIVWNSFSRRSLTLLRRSLVVSIAKLVGQSRLHNVHRIFCLVPFMPWLRNQFSKQ